MKKNINVGVIGLGARGYTYMQDALLGREGIKVCAVCDEYEDRVAAAVKLVCDTDGNIPVATGDYRDILKMNEIDAVLILSAWESHIQIAVEAMRAGKIVGCEVGGAYSVDDCFLLVHTYEETHTPCMLLENCCFNREELMALRMVREGLFGDIVHCEGGYRHDLREEIIEGEKNRHYRLRNYMHRNCENYPTHELGPIAKILDINRGNRMISLTSTASCAKGLNEFAAKTRGENDSLAKFNFSQGDVVITTIRCAHGQTIVLTLDTTLPRWYSRSFHIQGTKGIYEENNRSIFLENSDIAYEWNNVDKFFEKYEHPMWEHFVNEGVRGGHGGMDGLELNAFFAAIRQNKPMPVDVYDMAAWMAITPLSEQSIAQGGAPVTIPDFTNGKWTHRTPAEQWEYSLDK